MARENQPLPEPPGGGLLRRDAVRAILNPVARFFQTEAAGGIVLLICTVIALAAANSSWKKGWADLWHTHLAISLAGWSLDKPLEWWVNDGLMTLFFFVVGLEIKRELVSGELRDPRKAALPAAAALGGMIVPALIYTAIIQGGEGSRGWGIPMATDIAFAVGVLALLGKRVPGGLKILLLSLAIVDDLGAVLVIAIFYTGQIHFAALGWALAGLLAVALVRGLGVRVFGVYAVMGVLVWLAMVESNVHPTLAGVALGLMTPAGERVGKKLFMAVLAAVQRRLALDDDGDDDLKGFNEEVQAVARHAAQTLPPLDRLEAALHPWVAYAIMPLFALANAGVTIRAEQITSSVALAVALGLFLGKPTGIVLFSWAAVQSGAAKLPTGVNLWVLTGAGLLGGIGFTMSLFIANLALEGDLLAAGKAGTMAGSLLSAALGASLLAWLLPRRKRGAAQA
jgi:NhaA family Na+:H+ antiporter